MGKNRGQPEFSAHLNAMLGLCPLEIKRIESVKAFLGIPASTPLQVVRRSLRLSPGWNLDRLGEQAAGGTRGPGGSSPAPVLQAAQSEASAAADLLGFIFTSFPGPLWLSW